MYTVEVITTESRLSGMYPLLVCMCVCVEGEEASRDCVVAVLAMVFEEWVTTGFAGSYRISACGCGARAVGGLAR